VIYQCVSIRLRLLDNRGHRRRSVVSDPRP
jgi:hypothetical protein